MRPIPVAMGIALVGMLFFGVYHWFYVAPVTAVFIEGLLWVAAGGAVLGWCYDRTMLDHGRTGPRWGFVFGALFASTLIPSEIVGLLWGPFPTVATPGSIAAALPLAFLGVPVAVVIAWYLGDRKRILWPFVAAVALLHFMVGGSIANFGGRGVSLVIFAAFVVLELLGGTALGLLTTPAPQAASAQPDASTAATDDTAEPVAPDAPA